MKYEKGNAHLHIEEVEETITQKGEGEVKWQEDEDSKIWNSRRPKD